jgi:hypothetical protein
MNKTELRKQLQEAVTTTRDLKNYGLGYRGEPEWSDDTLESMARLLRRTADAIESYVPARMERRGMRL